MENAYAQDATWEAQAVPAEAAQENAGEEVIHDQTAEGAAAPGTQQSAADEQEDVPPSAEDAVRDHIAGELQALLEDGWTAEQLRAFAADEAALADMAAGQSARRAATAYLMRQAARPQPRARHGVPAMRTAGSGGVPRTHAIDRMSSSEFARFSDGLYERLLAGERISL